MKAGVAGMNSSDDGPIPLRPESPVKRMTLSDLGIDNAPNPGLAVTGLTSESGSADAGYLFAALPGTRVHGARLRLKRLSGALRPF